MAIELNPVQKKSLASQSLEFYYGICPDAKKVFSRIYNMPRGYSPIKPLFDNLATAHLAVSRSRNVVEASLYGATILTAKKLLLDSFPVFIVPPCDREALRPESQTQIDTAPLRDKRVTTSEVYVFKKGSLPLGKGDEGAFLYVWWVSEEEAEEFDVPKCPRGGLIGALLTSQGMTHSFHFAAEDSQISMSDAKSPLSREMAEISATLRSASDEGSQKLLKRTKKNNKEVWLPSTIKLK